MSRLSFRQRVALLTALAIALTVAAASAAVWVVSKKELYDQLDSTLALQAGTQTGPWGGVNTIVIHPDGSVTGRLAATIPITQRIRQVATGSGPDYFFTNSVISGDPARELVARNGDNVVIAVAQLAPTEHALSRIRFWILLIGGLGVVLAAALAAGVATLALRPVRKLTAAAETVAATGDLGARVEVGSTDDELGRLAARFNSMLAALEESVGRQRRLVADASHELRTPLTAARANVDLVREGKLPPGEDKHALNDAAAELDSLTTLVSDLVELSRGEERKLRVEEVQLDDLVASAVEREKSRAPERTFITSLSPTFGPRRCCPRRARGAQPARQRRQVLAPGSADRGERARRRGGRGGSRPRHRRGGSAARLRPLLPRCRGAREARLGARARDRPRSGRGPRRPRKRRELGGRRTVPPVASRHGVALRCQTP